MNKKSLAIIVMIAFCCATINTMGQTKNEIKEQKTFLKHADQCLDAMVMAAKDMSVKGACVIAYIPGEVSATWVSKMKVAGALQNGSANYLAIAYSKASEMADTHIDSGSRVREAMHGEFGYMGGVIQKIESGYILTVFSGASGEEDKTIAKKGLELLASFYDF